MLKVCTSCEMHTLHLLAMLLLAMLTQQWRSRSRSLLCLCLLCEQSQEACQRKEVACSAGCCEVVCVWWTAAAVACREVREWHVGR